ncbi:unnamed protein product [Cochlearia groenlandica]
MKSLNAYGISFLLMSTIFLFFISQASSYQMLICVEGTTCEECITQCDMTSYGGVCVTEGPKFICCCKKSPPPSYYAPQVSPSS